MKTHTCCFTGHRKIKKNRFLLKFRIRQTVLGLLKQGNTHFLVGGALGFDTLATQVLLSLKKKHPHVTITMVVPCVNQDNKWHHRDKSRYATLKSQVDTVHILSNHYYQGCMHARNRYLVDYSSVCIAYLNSPSGGTAYTVGYARKSGLTIINLA